MMHRLRTGRHTADASAYWTKTHSLLSLYALAVIAVTYAIGPSRHSINSSGDILGHSATVWDLKNSIAWHDWLGGGWSWAFGGGMSSVDFHSPAVYAAAALLHTTGLSSYTSFLYLGIAGSAAIPVCMYASARLSETEWPLKASMWAAGVLVALRFIPAAYGGSVYNSSGGAVSHALSLALAFLSTGLLHRALNENRPIWPPAIILGLAVSTHYLGAVLAVVTASVITLTTYWARPDRRRQVLCKTPAIAAIAAAVSAHWWIPKIFLREAIASPQWQNDNSMWSLLRPDMNVWFHVPPGWHALQIPAVMIGFVGLVSMATVDIRTRCDRSRLSGIGLGMFVSALVFAVLFAIARLPGQNWTKEVRFTGMFYCLCLIGFTYLASRLIIWTAQKYKFSTRVAFSTAAALVFIVPLAQQSQMSQSPADVIGEPSAVQASVRAIHDRLSSMGDCHKTVTAVGARHDAAVLTDGCVTASRHAVVEASTTYLHQLETDRIEVQKGYTDTVVSMRTDMGVQKIYGPPGLDKSARHTAEIQWQAADLPLYEYDITGVQPIHSLVHDPVRTDYVSIDSWADESIQLWIQEHYMATEQNRSADSIVRLAMGGPEHWPTSAEQSRLHSHQKAVASDVSMKGKTISFYVDRVGVPMLIKATWHPRWTTDDAEGPWLVSPGWMAVIPHDNEVVLRYEDDWISHVPYVSLGLLVVAGMAHGAVAARRKRRQPAITP